MFGSKNVFREPPESDWRGRHLFVIGSEVHGSIRRFSRSYRSRERVDEEKLGKQLKSRSIRDDRFLQYLGTLGSMRAQLAGSINGLPTDIFKDNDKKNRRACATNVSELIRRLSYKDILVKDQVQNSTKRTQENMERLLSVHGRRASEPVNDRFSKAPDSSKYFLINKLSRDDDDVASKLYRLTNSTLVRMKYQTFLVKTPGVLSRFYNISSLPVMHAISMNVPQCVISSSF